MQAKMKTAEKIEWVVLRGVLKGESEKAIKAEVEMNWPDGEPRGSMTWLPKSQIKETVAEGWVIPSWLAEAKADEIRQRCGVEGLTLSVYEPDGNGWMWV